MGVEVDRNADLLLERVNELLRRVRLQQTGHILDAEQVRAAMLQLLGELDVIIERIAVALRVENVARVAHGGFEQLALVQHLVHCDLHAGDPVERVEHAEHVDAAARALAHEGADNVVREVCVADEVAAAQEHLERDVGDMLPQLVEALPRGLMQEAVSDVEGRAAPHFE